VGPTRLNPQQSTTKDSKYLPFAAPVHQPADDVDVVGVETLEIVLGVGGQVHQPLQWKHLQMGLETDNFN
jgi:hypothetical protein